MGLLAHALDVACVECGAQGTLLRLALAEFRPDLDGHAPPPPAQADRGPDLERLSQRVAPT